MSPVSSMNGKPLLFTTWCDFGQTGRRTSIGRHTSIPVAARLIFRDTRRSSGYPGWQWVEDDRGRVVAGPFDFEHRPSAAARRDSTTSVRP